MRSSRFITAIAALALVAAPAASFAQTQTETVERTLQLPAGGTVQLKNFSGNVRVSGSTGDEVVIKAVRRATRERLDHIKLDITESGSTIVIDANKRDEDWEERNNNVVETTFDIQVPAAARLDIHAFSSDITVTDVVGQQTLE
ncbi:MAG TPA: hypothetical protein VLA20_04420, partial [Vicinamibacterales bacterium]|nr:hypothetical protein [Vicinamibacterales bacterium]